MSNDVVPFEKEKVKEYLDDAIKVWRKRKEEAKNEEDKLIAICYVDAFQSVRISLFGELLGVDAV